MLCEEKKIAARATCHFCVFVVSFNNNFGFLLPYSLYAISSSYLRSIYMFYLYLSPLLYPLSSSNLSPHSSHLMTTILPPSSFLPQVSAFAVLIPVALCPVAPNTEDTRGEKQLGQERAPKPYSASCSISAQVLSFFFVEEVAAVRVDRGGGGADALVVHICTGCVSLLLNGFGFSAAV